jgi:hypothetical protein
MEVLPGLIPGHRRQDALQGALDEKAGNLRVLLPRGLRTLFIGGVSFSALASQQFPMPIMTRCNSLLARLW